MRATVKMRYLASRRIHGSGTLEMQITRNRITRIIATSCYLSCDEWDNDTQKIIFSKNISSKRKRELSTIERKVRKDLRELREAAESLEVQGDYSPDELVNLFFDRQRSRMFCEYINRKVENLRLDGHFGTAHSCRYAAVSLLKFRGGRDIPFEKITPGLVEDFERYLLDEHKSLNTVSCYMRSLRSIYRQALREKIFVGKTKNDPFSGVFTGNEKTRKRTVSEETISQLAAMNLNGVNKSRGTAVNSPTIARDLFLFSYYTHGMSFSDMAELKKVNIVDHLIRYKHKKTNRVISIEMKDCMKKIIERYLEAGSEYIFPILRNCKDNTEYVKWKKICTALAVYNKTLNRLAKSAGIGEHLTSSVSRHSWATLASQASIPIASIHRSMGYESERAARIYISKTDFPDVGRFNRQVFSQISNNVLLPAGTNHKPHLVLRN